MGLGTALGLDVGAAFVGLSEWLAARGSSRNSQDRG